MYFLKDGLSKSSVLTFSLLLTLTSNNSLTNYNLKLRVSESGMYIVVGGEISLSTLLDYENLSLNALSFHK